MTKTIKVEGNKFAPGITLETRISLVYPAALDSKVRLHDDSYLKIEVARPLIID